MGEQLFQSVSGATFTVPEGVATVTFVCRGGRGPSSQFASGGLGGEARGTFAVTGAQQFTVNAPLGGAAADVRSGGTALADRIVVGGAGGTRGGSVTPAGAAGGDGGPGGHPAGGSGKQGASNSPAGGGSGGKGGTQSAGGNGPNPGSFGSGGSSHNPVDSGGAGGSGGDGWYGGGSGTAGGLDQATGRTGGGGGGGGGSSYVDVAATSATFDNGVWNAEAEVLVVWPDSTPPDPPGVQVASFVSSLAFDVTWQHNPTMNDDPQLGWEIEIREQGATVLDVNQSGATSVNTYEVTSLPPGNFEVRVRTEGQAGFGGWSMWLPFTTVDPPAAPNIQVPSVDDIIPDGVVSVGWSTSVQEAAQVRLTDDDAGDPSEVLTVLPTVGSEPRSAEVELDADLVTRHVQVRVRETVWSLWASVRFTVAFEPPDPPTVSVTAAPEGAVTVDVTPAGTSAPTAVETDVWRRTDDGDGERVAAGLDPDVTYVDWTVASRKPYQFRVQQRAANKVAVWSGWLPEA